VATKQTTTTEMLEKGAKKGHEQIVYGCVCVLFLMFVVAVAVVGIAKRK